MRLITGDECGLLKECNTALAMKASSKTKGTTSSSAIPSSTVVTSEKDGILRINPIEHASRRHGVVALAWNKPGLDDRFSSLHMDGVVELWERNCNENTTKRPSFGKYRHAGTIANVFGSADALSRPMGLSRLSRNGKNLLCACNHAGKVVLLSPDSDEQHLSSFDAFPLKTPTTGENNKSVCPRFSAMAIDEPTGRIAMGGKERETTLFDLETSKQVWKAKNLPPDVQTLLQPQVWPTAILFLQQHQQPEISGQNIIAVGTAYAQVRLYDVRIGDASASTQQRRRPIQTTPAGFLEHRVTSLCQINGSNSNEIVVGDAAGFLHTIDLRRLPTIERVKTPIAKQEQVGTHGRFVGPTGSVRQIVHDTRNNKMAVAGLDRMLRIYDTHKNKRKELICFYLKQRLNCVLVGQEEDNHFESVDDPQNLHERYNDEQDIDQEDVVDDYFDSDDDDDDDDGNDTSPLENEDEAQDVVDSNSNSDSSGDHYSDDDSESSKDENDDEVHTPRKKQRQFE